MTTKKTRKVRILFSDYFKIDPETLKKENLLDISLVADLPLFIDPFLLFNSNKKEYQKLHKQIIDYILFLKQKSKDSGGKIPRGLLDHLYRFPEVEQNWLGFSFIGNKGHGLGRKFAITLNDNFKTSLSNFGKEEITTGSHLEKLALVSKGVGKDNISDFSTNLIKEHLLDLTQTFSKKYIDESLLKEFSIPRVHFNYDTESWVDKKYTLPFYQDDYILLSPRDLLTKDETWVNKIEFYKHFETIPFAIGNEELRAKVNNYLIKTLKENTKEKKIEDGELLYKTTPEEKLKSYKEVLVQFPELIDYFLKLKEERKEEATPVSLENVQYVEKVLVENFTNLLYKFIDAEFYSKTSISSYQESLKRAIYFKKCIEEHDVWRNLYSDGKPVAEDSIQRLFKLVWIGTLKDVNREVQNGLGTVDFTISEGALDKTVVEFKLAKSNSLEKNLKSQLETYKKVNNTKFGIWIIVYFSNDEKKRAESILNKLGISDSENIILVDAREKISASKL